MRRLRFKHFMPERVELSTTGEETLLSVSEYYGVKPRSQAFEGDEGESRADSLEGYRRVHRGDFVMNYMLAWKGAYGVSEFDGIVSPAYAVYRIDPRQANKRYIHHRLRSEHTRAMFRARSKGIIESRLRLYPDTFLSMSIDLPDVEAQGVVADFLDRETALIDQLIEKKQRMFEVREQQFFAEISSMLTKGLNLKAPTKPSGLDWLGDIPAHWVWSRMKDVCSEIIDCKNRTPPQVDDGPYLVVRTSCIRGGSFDATGGYMTDVESFEEWTKRGRPRAGDVFITREAPAGEACLVPPDTELCLGQRMMLYRPNQLKILPEYIVYTVYSAIGQNFVNLRRKGSTVGHLRVPEVYNFPCLLPPIEEQHEIVRVLSSRSSSKSSMMSLLHNSIDRLREFRSALITAAVTGQIDVTTWGKQGQTDRRLDKIQEEMGA